MGELPFPDCLPPAAFAEAWRLHYHHLAQRHPLYRTTVFFAILILELLFLALLDYQPSALQPQQSAMIMVQLQSPSRLSPRLKEPALHFVRARAPNVIAPQIAIMPDTNPAPQSTLPVTMALASPLADGTPQGGGSSAGGAAGDGRATAASCVDAAYLAEISRHVQLYFFFPGNAAGARMQGVVYVHFISDHAGNYRLLEITKSSGHPELDQAALVVMHRASPLPMIPGRLHADLVNGVLPIVFKLKGSEISLTWETSGDC